MPKKPERAKQSQGVFIDPEDPLLKWAASLPLSEILKAFPPSSRKASSSPLA